MHPRRSPRLKLVLSALALALAGAVAAPLWRPALGYALVRDDGPAKADIAVVLAGDASGSRILEAADLIRRGYAPVALVSGSASYYGVAESDLAIPFAVRRGNPPQWFLPFPNSSLSTRQEAVAILAELRRRGVHTFLLVTSDFHTARAARIFRSLERGAGGGPDFRTIPAPDPFFRAGAWWQNRESQKIFLTEWCKTLTGPLGF